MLSCVGRHVVELPSGHPRPSRVRAPVYRGCPAWTHGGVTESKDNPVTKSQPLCVLVGVVASCVLCARVPRVLRDVLTTECNSCATENTYTPPRLEALFELSIVIILRHLYRSLQQFCRFWVLCPTRHIVRHVLYFVRDLTDFPCLLSAVSQSTLFM